MRKWAGKRNYQVIWEPLLKGKFTIYHDQISMPWLWSKFATRVASRDKTFKEKLGYIQGSWGQAVPAVCPAARGRTDLDWRRPVSSGSRTDREVQRSNV